MDDILALNNLFMNAMNKPIIPISGNTTITLNQSGKVFELNSPSANATITLPTPTNGFNATFVCNNSSSYTYTFTTPSGGIIWSNTSSASVTPNTASGVYFLVADGSNYLLSYKLGAIPSGGNYHSTSISNSFSMGANTTSLTTYTIGSFNVTFPSFSPSGKWKIIVQVTSNMINNNAGLGWLDYDHVITDGNNTVYGAGWVVYSNSGIGYGIGDTFIMGDYTQGSNITFTIKIQTIGGTAPTQYGKATINYAFIY